MINRIFLTKLIFTLALCITLHAQQVTVSTIYLTSSLSLDGLIVADDGTLYGAAGYNGNKIYKINMDGMSEIFASSLGGPIDMDFDNDGNMYVTTFTNQGVYKITPSGTATRFATVSVGPSGIVLNRQTSDVFVSHFGNAPYSGNSVYKIDASGLVSVFVQNGQLRSPVSLAIDNDDNLYTPNIGDSKIFKITPDATMSLLATLPTSSAQYNIGHIAYANGKLYVTGNTGRHYLYEVELDGSYTIIAGTGVAGGQDGEGLSAQFNGPNGIAASVTGDTLFISELNSPSRLRVVDLTTATAVNETQNNIQDFFLMQNFPNPFNPSTKIHFTLNEEALVTLTIYDVLGNEVSTLVNEEKPAGKYEVDFNSFRGNKTLSSGIYFYRLKAGSSVEIKKMVLSK